jgi:hypothetical protein
LAGTVAYFFDTVKEGKEPEGPEIPDKCSQEQVTFPDGDAFRIID